MKPHRTLAILLAAGSAAYATPSGLNNIPTADTPSQGDYVIQTYSTVGYGQKQDFNLGFKTGFDLKVLKLEVGVDSHISPGNGGPAVAQAKIAVPLGTGLPTIAAGVANISFSDHDRRRAGDPFPYFVATQDLKWFRVHAGIAEQFSQPLPFFGLDRTFKIKSTVPAQDGKSDGKSGPKTTVKERDLFMLCGDGIQQLNHTWLLSAGVKVPVCKHFVFETWGNFPTDGTKASLTIKGDFVIHF